MSKYIADSIRNNSRFIISELTKPQSKAVSEIIRGLFVKNTPILRHLAQDDSILTKKQAEKYSHHLGNINIKDRVDDFAFKQARKTVKNKTIIAYDLTDISKESSKKMENISRVFDGSKRKTTNGFLLHGVGINNHLVKLEVHDSDAKTLNQTRRKIVDELSEKLDKQGIWVFDRGNDDKQIFKYLRQTTKVQFIARVKLNRQVVIKETGVKIQVKNLKPGKYKVYLMNFHNTHVDTNFEYTLVIQKHLQNKPPIRLISSLQYAKYTKKELVKMYLERWGVENIYRRVKTKFLLEKIRVLCYKKFVNLVSLIQFAIVISTSIFIQLLESTTVWIAGVLATYKHFIKMKSVSINIDSFISFMSTVLKPLFIKKSPPPNNQLVLL